MTDYTIQEICRWAADLEVQLREKGMRSPDVEVVLNYSDFSPVRVKMNFFADQEFITEHWNARDPSTLETIFLEVETYIDNLKSASQFRKEAFLQRFSDVIAEARELDLPIDFINPLEESMRSLSENIIEDNRGAPNV